MLLCIAAAGCELLDDDIGQHGAGDPPFEASVSLGEVAELLAALPIGVEQVTEVHDAVSASAGNGYDEEYMMRDLLTTPGAGVGGGGPTKAGGYGTPLRALIADYVDARYRTRAGERDTAVVNAYLRALTGSGMQIYWPYSEDWDGRALPVITFDPGDGSERNEGYVLRADRRVERVIVDEEMARTRPVWVVNTNDDSAYRTLELLRREDPSWGRDGGGSIAVRSGKSTGKTLFLKTFHAKRNYDPWFAGASEFFVKCGSVEGFSASTEAELALYSPSVTDFLIVVKRREVGTDKPFDVVLVSDWTSQLDNCAFIITEDDGGTQTSWKCAATVKYNSKSYGFDVSIPIRTRDDIVWRGQLSSRYIEKYNGEVGHFGDVDLVLSLE